LKGVEFNRSFTISQCLSDKVAYEKQAEEGRDQSQAPLSILDSEHCGGSGSAAPLAIADSDRTDGVIVAPPQQQAIAAEKALILGPHWAAGGSKSFPQHKAGDEGGIIPVHPESPFFRGKLEQPIMQRASRFRTLADGYARDRGDVPKQVMYPGSCNFVRGITIA